MTDSEIVRLAEQLLQISTMPSIRNAGTSKVMIPPGMLFLHWFFLLAVRHLFIPLWI